MIGSPPSSVGVEKATVSVSSPAVTEVIVGAVGVDAAARVTTIVVVVETPVFVVTTVMVLDPTANARTPDAVPDVTDAPLTVNVDDE